ncbi:NEL-type E3 ubiquitin ligase domain-containing protein [Pseudomonas alkylphenolica]|uniref:NEL-type E3 ubiquitin ligase domain-containing protein n=1 Tax=Pseudomonas alkylphenolica TaxID=237609 RepID=UPI00315DFEEE
METSHSQEAATADTLATEQTYQDSIIGKRLPAWLRLASAEQLSALGDAMRHSLVVRQRLSKALARIQGIDSFAVAALEKALKERFADEYNVGRWKFITGHREPVINPQPVGVHLTEVVYEEIPLVEAALRNFTADEAKSGGQPKGNRLSNARAGNIKPPSAIEFARLCRDTDLGGQYQRHLDSVLQPQARSGSADNVAELLASSHRYTMLTDAYEARIKGGLTESELQLVVGLCDVGRLGRLDGDPVVAMQLNLLGCALEQIVVLNVFDEGVLSTTTKCVLVHIPGDPNGAWTVCKNLRYLANELGRRLRSNHYQRFFSRFVRRRDSQRFFSVVIPAYADLAIWANINLKEHVLAYRRPLFEKLAEARIRQIKDDAAMIAVPVVDLDREVQREHDQRLAAEGWALLGLAGFFVPAIGAALLAVNAWQLLGEVYHGIDAWHEGDTSEAFDHLLNVAIDLAVIAATAVGVSVVSRVWQRSSVVDALVPAQLEDGSTKLWNQDLTPFRSAQPVPQATRDSLGVHRLAEQSWIEMDGQYYAVVEQASAGQWQLRPQNGHGPLLRHNGAGAWRLWSEQPAEWDDTQRMFRRLGGAFRGLDAEQIDLVLSIHGLGNDHLRALHVYAQAPSAELQDSVMRIRLDQRIRDLVRRLRSGESVEDITVLHHAQGLPGAAGLSDQNLAELAWSERRQLFQRLYDSMQDSDGPGIAALRRVFPSLHRSAANVLVGRASTADRQRLLDSGRVALHLAEAARASVQQIRMARAFEAFVIDTSQNADTARVALGMLEHLPGTAGVQWRLIEGHAGGPQLLVTGEGPRVVSLIHQNGTFQLLDGDGSSIGDAGELFEVMAMAYDEPQREAMAIADPFAHNVRVLLGRQAVRRREEVASLLSARGRNGWFHAPQRLADGRFGYPLSGRGSAGSTRRGRPQALFARVRAVYPAFTDAQVIAWLNDMQHAGVQIEAELGRLSQELELLNSSLRHWADLPDNAGVRDDRHYFRESLVNCWQRRTSLESSVSEDVANYRFTLYGAEIGSLPEIPTQVSFNHVYELALLGMGLPELPDGFIRAFSNLRILEAPGNFLTRVPNTLVQLEHLRELDLFNNQIVLNEVQATILSNCESLEYLNLSYNPLGRSFSLRRLIRLRRLHLRQTGINRLPYAILDCPDLLLADLRDNQITELSEHFYHSPPWLRRIIMLADNPLTAQEALRLHASLLDAGVAPVHAAAVATVVTTRQRWLDAAGSLMRDEWSARWEDLENQPGANDFFDMLRRLLETADFQQNGQALANRVFTMIRAMNDHASLREALLNQVTQNLTCQDSVALCFSNLELRMLVWRAESSTDNPQAALLYLGRQLWRLDEVDRIALEDIQARRASGSDPDQIEVALAYRLALRDALDLPAQPSDMLFGEVAGLDAQRIARALARVEAAETPEQLAQSLVAREFWQEHLLRTQRTRFDTIDAPFHDRLAVLMDAETVPEGERVAQMNHIRDARLQAQRALMFELTLALLRGTSGHSMP